MKIEHVTYAVRDLRLKKPLRTSRGTVMSRRAIIVAVHSVTGRAAVGECSPLPEFGTETFDSAELEARRLAGTRALPSLVLDNDGLEKWLAAAEVNVKKTPAVAFALQCALAALAAEQYPFPPAPQFHAITHSHVPVNGLMVCDDYHKVMQSVRDAVADGIGTLKFKVGVQPVEEEVRLLTDIRAEHPATKMRLDANCAWSLDEARRFFERVRVLDIEYIEDPLRDPSIAAIKELRSLGMRVALDESLAPLGGFHAALTRECCDVIIIKSARIGSVQLISNMAHWARDMKVPLVFTSMIESSLSLAYQAVLAAQFGHPDYAHGLGTAGMLADDLLVTPLLPQRGWLRVPFADAIARLLHRDIAAELQIATP